MGFQKKTTQTTVVASLTDLGKWYLLTDPNLFEVTHFAVFDDEVDYTLYNPSHPNGTDSYGKAIENIKLLEPASSAIFQGNYPLIRDYDRNMARYRMIKVTGAATNGTVTLTDLDNPVTLQFEVLNGAVEFGYDLLVTDTSIVTIGTESDRNVLPAGWSEVPFSGVDPSVGRLNNQYASGALYRNPTAKKFEITLHPGLNPNTQNLTAKIIVTERQTKQKSIVSVFIERNNDRAFQETVKTFGGDTVGPATP